MNPRPSDGYGSRGWRLWWQGLRDRAHGRHARANARWGHLRPPTGRGRVVWLRAGAAASSVRLAAELLGAIRDRRHDVRLILTFEEEHPALLRRYLPGVERMGFGYGPCDAPRAVRRALARLDPLGLILVDCAPAARLMRAAAERGVHVVAYHTPAATDAPVEAAYPKD
ncbi:MAG: glycosyltransferase N-terminal domain-containing protein, partial [Gammaproteobacteria bacterium]